MELVEDAASWLWLRPASFNAVVLRHVVPHLDRSTAVEFVSSVRQALRPGGIVLAQAFNGALASAPYTIANDLTHRVTYTEHSLRPLLRLAGFTSTIVLPLEPMSGRGLHAYGLRSARGLVRALRGATLVAERGASGNPTIFTKDLLAVANPPT